MQEIFIYMDDSGTLTKKDECVFYGGIVFLTREEKERFEMKYKRLLESLHCKKAYCRKEPGKCQNRCPEIKSSILKSKDRKKFMNLIMKEITYFVIVEINELERVDFSKSNHIGRYQEYAQKIGLKKICEKLVENQQVDLTNPPPNIYLY